ncbi:hypothetical protein NSP21_24470, partial [Salmonella enterica]|nr:hypothetical protein [Salmonella enterica]
IRQCGEGTSKRLSARYREMPALIAAATGPDARAELCSIDDIGPIVSAAIEQFFHEPRNREEVYRLLGEVQPEAPAQRPSGNAPL